MSGRTISHPVMHGHLGAVLGLLAALALWPGIAQAQVGVAVVEPALEGEATVETSRELQDAVLAGLGPGAARTFVAEQVAQALAPAGEEPPATDPDARLRAALRSLGAQAFVALRFGQAGQVYEVEAELRLVADGRRLGVVAQTCQVCTWAEALATVARAGEGLRPSLPGLVDITTTPADAAVTVDGAAATSGEPIAFPPGRHRIEAAAPGHSPQVREVEVVSGGRIEVQLALAANEAETTVPGEPEPPVAPTSSSRSRTFLLLGGVAAGLSLAMIAPGAAWLAIDGDCASGSPVGASGLCEQVYDTWPGGLAMTLVGAGLAVAAVVLFVMGARARRLSHASAVVPALLAAGPDGGFAAALLGRF